jgi:hypothetical protein
MTYLFICGLFNSFISSLDYEVSNGRMIRIITSKLQSMWKKTELANSGIIPEFVRWGLKNPTRNLT